MLRRRWPVRVCVCVCPVSVLGVYGGAAETASGDKWASADAEPDARLLGGQGRPLVAAAADGRRPSARSLKGWRRCRHRRRRGGTRIGGSLLFLPLV